MKKHISLKLTLEEWYEIEDLYKHWLMERGEPLSRHAWMKKVLTGNVSLDALLEV